MHALLGKPLGFLLDCECDEHDVIIPDTVAIDLITDTALDEVANEIQRRVSSVSDFYGLE
jgi:hypothetical protein